MKRRLDWPRPGRKSSPASRRAALRPAGFRRARWWLAAGLGCGFWPGLAAHAQQALLSAYSLDAVLKTQAQAQARNQIQTNANSVVTLAPTRAAAGPVQFDLTPYSSVSVDDNITLVPNNTESDIILGEGANVGMVWQASGKSVVQLTSQVGYNFYLQHPGDDYLGIAPGTALTWGFSLKDWTFTFFDQFNYTHNNISNPSISGVSNIPIVDNTVGLRVDWQPGAWLLEAGFSHDNYFSTSSEFNYLNNEAEYFFARAAWQFAPQAKLGLEASASLTHFALPFQPDSTSYSAGPYLEWQVDPHVHLTLRGGPTLYQFAALGSQQPASSLPAYYVNFDLVHQINPYWSEELEADRSVSLGFIEGATYSEVLNLAYSVNWQPQSWLGFALTLGYQTGTQPFQQFVFFTPFSAGPLQVTEHFSRYSITARSTYQLTKKIDANLTLTHYTRESNLSYFRYADDMASLFVEYHF